MIARLRGKPVAYDAAGLVLDVGGVGYRLLATPAAVRKAQDADEVSLETYLHVREDALTLYGFATRDDLALFEQLIGVSGIGPRAALGLLSALDYERLTMAIAGGQVDALRRVPGIGQKTAERIVLELRDKVTPPAAGIAPPEKEPEKDADVIAALMGLGYSQLEASAAAAELVDGHELPLEERVRLALRYFASP